MWDPPTGVICKDWIKAWLDSYLDQLILGPVLSITVFPMAMCLYEVWLLLALAVLLDCSLLQLKKEDSGYLTGIIWSQLIEIQS